VDRTIRGACGGLIKVKAVILAAGKGTRLAELTRTKPKPMVEVGDKPALERIILALSKVGVHDFVIVVGYLSEVVEQYFGDGTPWGVNIRYVKQEVPDGTGSALHLTKDAVGDNPFFMTYGDILVPASNYAGMIQTFEQTKSRAILGLNWIDDPYKGAAVYLGPDNRVERIIEKPPKGTSTTNWNNAGMYVFDPVIFEYTARLRPSARGEYELPDAIQAMLSDGLDIRGYPLEGYWRDIGTPQDVEAAQELFKEE
jgi:NDP-sugar pyrophosphorylase family protein